MKRLSSLILIFSFCGTLVFAAYNFANNRQIAAAQREPLKLKPAAAPQSSRQGRKPQRRENFDIRADHIRSLESRPETATAQDAGSQPRSIGQSTQESLLKRARPGAQFRWSSLTGTPSRVWSFSQTLSAPQTDRPENIARNFLKDNIDLYQLNGEEIEGLKIARQYQTEHNGLSHVTLRQQVNGIDLFQGDYTIHIDRNGAVISAGGELIPAPDKTINSTNPSLSAAAALRIAAREVDQEITGPLNLRLQPNGPDLKQEFDRSAGFGDDVPARLIFFPLSAKLSRLSWEFILTMRETPEMYYLIVDAERGSLLYLHNLTCFDENPLKPHGPVYTKESPRPNLPRTSDNPPVVEREDLPFNAASFNGKTIFPVSNQHYDWWAGASASTLISNNTSTYLDRDSTVNQPDQPRLSVPDGNFNFPVNLAIDPIVDNNQKAAQVNLFYWINRYHDILYSFGFNEGSGNFQTNNFGLGGQANDAVNGEAQDGSGTNNANFSTPPDGRPGRVQMYLWTGTPMRDGDFDQGVVIHEMTHGLSNRLIGDGLGLGGTQSGGMGEGWSDYFGLALLANESDGLDLSYPVGQFVTNNYTRGIRRYPYSTQLSASPLTFRDFNLTVEVHAIGEIWCNALWEMRAQLIRKYGFQEGQRQSIQLVVDGMKLTPIVPTFLDARNAIILADRVNNGGANGCLIWQAFAKRGMGYSAKTNDTEDGAPVESFDTAPFCSDTGILSLDKNNYVNGETLRLSLGDRNATGTVAVQLRSSATGDQETLNLTPETNVPGSFNGKLLLSQGRANPGDGILQGSAEKADQIIVTYNDPNNGNGNPAQVVSNAAFTREKTVFEDSTESGNQGWIASGKWAITNSRASSGTKCWTDSPAGNYTDNDSTSLTSPLFNFTGLAEVTLSFSQSYDIEERYDFGIIEYSNDDGVTWSRAAASTGTQNNFTQTIVSLRGLDGQSRARIRFRLASDANLNGDGWYIDDMRLTARSNNANIIPPSSVISPVITSVSPAFGSPAGGTSVTIGGLGFTDKDTTSVTFDGANATSVNVLGSSTITAITPAHAAGPVTVRVINKNGGVSLPGGFTYYIQGSAAAVPSITAVFPDNGSVRGGTAVTILGSNFSPETVATFGGSRGDVTFINSTALRVKSPASGSTGRVEVVVGNGTSLASLLNGFNYTATSPPTVSMLGPGSGESYFARSVLNIRWRSSDNTAVARHRISLMRNSGAGLQFISDIATDLPGDVQGFNWAIPANVDATDKARIRVTAIDDEGAETEAFSSGDFSLAVRWENLAQLPISLQRQQVAGDGKYLYSIGGRTSTSSANTVATVYRFDPSAATPSWSSSGLTPMPTGLNGGEAVFLNGKVYIPGGVNSSTQLSILHLIYDVEANNWTTSVSAPSGSFFYALAADQQRGIYYQTGGLPTINSSIGTSIVRRFDPASSAWSDLPPMQTARYGHEAAIIEGKLYVAGGFGTSGGLTSCEVFDFNTQQWTAIAPLNRQRLFGINVVGKDPSGNPLWFVIGGQDTTGALPGTEVYDVRNNRWLVLDDSFNLNPQRTLLGGATLGNYIYAVGGSVSTTLNRATERMRIDSVIPVLIDQSPVLVVPAAQVALANAELKFIVSANDLGSNTPLTITANGLPAGAGFSSTTATNNSARGIFTWTPTAADSGQTFNVIFTANDGQLTDIKQVTIRVIAAGSLAAVNAADFRTAPISADSIASAFGINLAIRTETANELPLPTELAGTRLTVNGILAPLFFVSSSQINFGVPPAIDPGSATIIVSTPTGNYALGNVQIESAAPAIFTANATGRGDAAAVATPDGIVYQQQPFDVTINGRPNILVLYGTGVRRANAANPDDDNGVAESVTVTIDGKPANILYAGAQGGLSGLDQINVELPGSLAGLGPRRVEVVMTVNGVATNRVTIQLK